MIDYKIFTIGLIEKKFHRTLTTLRFTLSLTLFSLFSGNAISAEQLTTCSISAKVDYTPALVDGFYWITITGTHFKQIGGDFCRDRVGKQSRIRVPEYLFSTTRPRIHGDITLIESREVIVVGNDKIEIRYFTETP